MKEEEIKELYDYYNVKSDIESVFGGWTVSTDGDVINIPYRYPIYCYRLNEGLDSWLDHLRSKTWFDAENECEFVKAFQRATQIINAD